ncbi:MAG: bifunctional pyr operon transcriptional regulator/uracil phosphoribosyltransferase PyrR [Bacteroidota bacterium]
MAETVLMTPERVHRTLTRLAYEVIERNRGVAGLLVFGLKQRGASLADRLADALELASGEPVPRYPLPIAGFRDDRGGDPMPVPADAPRAEGRDVLLVDDVIFTGRSARAALDAVLQYGRPRSIQLAVLIDRGHREVPVHPDFVGRRVPTKHAERVAVDIDGPSVHLLD